MVADPKNTIVTSKIAPQFLLLKLHFGKAEFGILVKGIRNIVHFFKSEVNTVCHTLSRITGQEEPVLYILAEQQKHGNMHCVRRVTCDV